MTNPNPFLSNVRKAVLVAIAIAFCAAPALAADQDFTVHNHTGRTMKALFVSETSKDDWGSDLLGDGSTVADGSDVDIKFDRNETECQWDVRAEFEDGSYGEVRDVDFCTVTDVTFNPG
jgi:hypothetical protein